MKEKIKILKTKTLLFVEDEPDLINIYLKAFQKIFLSVDFAIDGNEGVKKIFENTYDIIFLDINMPNKSGIEVLIETNSHIKEFKKNTSIYMISASRNEEDIKEIPEIATKILQKPVNLSKIIDIIYENIKQ
jgi:DNA-binding response OmpR family regulator